MELIAALLVALAVLAAAAAPAILLLTLRKRDEALVQHLITYLRQTQGLGDPVHIVEQKLALEADKVKLQREQAAIRAAELMGRERSQVPGVR